MVTMDPGSLASLVGGVAVPWFPQMWAAAILLNGRLLRENALQGAEQLGAEIVRALNGRLCPPRGLAGARSLRLCLEDWLVERPRAVTLKKAPFPPMSCPRFFPLALSHIQGGQAVKRTGPGDRQQGHFL